ncbi:uncharacterized protein LOC142335445 isoform X4 [Convolutriloba macropyga]|uniref:uncharacterized protein LOC142335445 isoform X4 n=1 Tax=Convolutriloba macropyga TaxID=536237 RepID=UPI003F5213A0
MAPSYFSASIFSVKKSITLSSFPVLVAIVTCLFLMMSETVEARGVLIDERHIERQVKRILDIQERAKKNSEWSWCSLVTSKHLHHTTPHQSTPKAYKRRLSRWHVPMFSH